MRKIAKTTSFVLQTVYSVICLFEVIVCLIYRSTYDTKLGEILASVALFNILPIAAIVIALPTSLVLNIIKTVSCYKEKSTWRNLWLIWTIISPILYFFLFAFAAYIFVVTTGGV